MDTALLIKEARQGSAAAQKCLFDQWCEKMLLVCRRYVKTREDAEEILLDGFYKFFKTLQNFNYQGEPALQAWIKKIMVNECLMFLRKKNVFNIVADTVAAEVLVEEEALANLSAAELMQMIIQLPVGYRTVFNLYAIEGMSHAEIAGLLQIADGTSKSQLRKARLLLQKMLLQKEKNYGNQQQK